MKNARKQGELVGRVAYIHVVRMTIQTKLPGEHQQRTIIIAVSNRHERETPGKIPNILRKCV